MTNESTADGALVGALLDDLKPLDPAARPMFGGYCIYAARTPVAIVHGGRAYLWVPEDDRNTWQSHGSEPFTSPHGQTLHAYHQVPNRLLENSDGLLDHVRRALRARRDNRPDLTFQRSMWQR